MRATAMLTLAAALLAAAPAPAQDKPAQDKPAQDKTVELKLSTWVPPKHPLNPAFQAWADSIAQASNGSINSTLFTSEQLGKAVDHYDMVRDGIADAGYVNPGYQPGRFPVIAVGELPFLIADAKGGTSALDEWYRKYAAREMKDVRVCAAFVHDPGAYHGKKKLLHPTELKGMKIRPAHATIGQFVVLLGGTNVQASAPEARDVLERGVADAIFFPWGSVMLFGLDKVVKEHMDVPLYATTFVWALNKAKIDAMSPAQRKVIDDHCTTEWARRIADPWTEFEAAGRDKLRSEPGHDVYKLTPEQVAEWKKAAEPLQKQWADKAKAAGIDSAAAFAELKASLAKHDAAY